MSRRLQGRKDAVAQPLDDEPQLRHIDVPIGFSNFDRYRRGTVQIHVHFAVLERGAEVLAEFGDYCAILAKALGELVDHSPPSKDVRGSAVDPGDNGHKLSVFVRVLQASYHGEGVDGCSHRSVLVGLQPLDDCRCLGGHAGDGAVETAAFVASIAPSEDEWASLFGPDVLTLNWKSGLVVALPVGDADRQMVERRADVMDHVPEDHRQLRVRRLVDSQAVAPEIGITLLLGVADGPVGVSVRVPEDFRVDLLQVLLRPVELEPPGSLGAHSALPSTHMPKRDSDTQVTSKGTPIPVPKRGEFDANLEKLLKAPAPPKKVMGRRAKGLGDG